jgi:uncharacterized protein (DUF1778 family)
MGRPARNEAPSAPIAVRVSPAERERIERAARENHQSLSQFQRDALLDRADQTLDSRNFHDS